MTNKSVQTGVLATAIALLLALGAGCDDRTRQAPAQASEPAADKGQSQQANAPGGSEHYATSSPDRAVPVGQKAQTEVEILPTGKLKINEEFPWSIEFTKQEGIELAQAAYSKDDFELSEASATVPLLVEVDEAGEHELEAIADFSVCTDTECFVMRGEPLSFNIEAQEEANTNDDSK